MFKIGWNTRGRREGTWKTRYNKSISNRCNMVQNSIIVTITLVIRGRGYHMWDRSMLSIRQAIYNRRLRNIQVGGQSKGSIRSNRNKSIGSNIQKSQFNMRSKKGWGGQCAQKSGGGYNQVFVGGKRSGRLVMVEGERNSLQGFVYVEVTGRKYSIIG